MKLAQSSSYPAAIERAGAFLAAPARARRALHRNDAAFPGWVALGLVAVSVGISALEIFAICSEHWSYHPYEHFKPPPIAIPFPLPGLGAILLYIFLAVVQPRLFPWPRCPGAYLMAIFVVTVVLGLFGPPPFRLLGYIAM